MAPDSSPTLLNTDIVVIGMGPAGEAVAGILAKRNVDVIGIDQHLVGGECAYYGCVPSKMMVRAADLVAETRRADRLAGPTTITPDWSLVANRIREATSNWDDAEAVESFERRGGRFVRGIGQIVGHNRVSVGEQVIEAGRGIVLATGTRPAVPPIDGLAVTPYWTNRDALTTERVPDSLAILGGGAIGCELAQVFARFGSDVTIIESEQRIHNAGEPEASDILVGALERDGITVLAGHTAEHVTHRDDGFSIELSDGPPVEAEQLLVAVGRDAHLDDLGVQHYGLDDGSRFLETAPDMRVADGLWAVGDVTGQALFTHVGTYQARVAIASILGEKGPTASYHAIPAVTFTDPEIGRVGMTEQQAIDADVDIATSTNDGSARAWLHDALDDVVIKLIADRERKVLIGATAVGPSGGEVLGALAVAVHAEVPIADLGTMIYAYPTFHRAIDDAVQGLDL